jgi:hypothetical protein
MNGHVALFQIPRLVLANPRFVSWFGLCSFGLHTRQSVLGSVYARTRKDVTALRWVAQGRAR